MNCASLHNWDSKDPLPRIDTLRMPIISVYVQLAHCQSPFLCFKTAHCPSHFSPPRDFPLVSAATKILPSPDWFVGVDSISSLCTGDHWISSLSVPVYPHDAGMAWTQLCCLLLCLLTGICRLNPSLGPRTAFFKSFSLFPATSK